MAEPTSVQPGHHDTQYSEAPRVQGELARRALRKHTGIIVSSLSAVYSTIADELYSKEVVSKSVYTEVNDTSCGRTKEERMRQLLKHLSESQHCEAFTVLVEILRDHIGDVTAIGIAKDMERTYSSLVESAPVHDPVNYPNWSELNDDEKEEIQDALFEENEQVKDKYWKLITSVQESFRARAVNPAKIIIALQSRGCYQEDTKVSSIDDAFVELTKVKHTSWYDTHLFELIIDESGDQSDKKHFHEYHNDILKPYLQRSIFAVPPEDSPTSPATKLHLKIVDELVAKNLMATDGKIILLNLKKMLCIPTLNRKSVMAGCIELVFSIPELPEEAFQNQYENNEKSHYISYDEKSKKYWITANIEDIIMYQYYTDAKPGKNGENLQYRELTVLQKMILYHQVKLKESGEEIDAATESYKLGKDESKDQWMKVQSLQKQIQEKDYLIARLMKERSSMLQRLEQHQIAAEKIILQEKANPVQPYKMNKKDGHHGYLLVINNIKRRTAEFDDQRLVETFIALGYRLYNDVCHRDLTANDIRQLTSELASADHSQYDSVVVCLLSHGGVGFINGSDGVSIDLEEIRQYFVQSPTLAGKPKLFFIASSRGNKVPETHRVHADSDDDESPIMLLPQQSDIFFGYSTTPDTKSFRFTDKGSWYVTELCKSLNAHHKDLDLLSMVQLAHYEVTHSPEYTYERHNLKGGSRMYKQAPQMVSTLTHPLYLN